MCNHISLRTNQQKCADNYTDAELRITPIVLLPFARHCQQLFSTFVTPRMPKQTLRISHSRPAASNHKQWTLRFHRTRKGNSWPTQLPLAVQKGSSSCCYMALNGGRGDCEWLVGKDAKADVTYFDYPIHQAAQWRCHWTDEPRRFLSSASRYIRLCSLLTGF
jgi:hypothetical protein